MAPGDLQEAFRQGVLAAMRAGQRPMLTGLRYGPGPNDVTLAGADTGKSWVRWPDESREQTQVWGSANRVNATVLVGPGWDGEDKILEVISRPTAQVMQEAVRTVLQPQGFDELVPRNIPSEQLKPGRVGPSESGGTYIHVDAFDHKLGRWTGAPDLDVGSLFPVNLGEYGRIGVYLDPQSNGLVAFAGEQVYTYEDFTEGDRDLVPDGMYALGAVIVTNGGTISASNKFEDWRKFLEAKGDISSSLPAFGAQEVVTIASGVLDLSGASGRNFLVAAESGTADTVDSITGLGDGDAAVFQADAGDTITFAHDSGVLNLYNGANIALSGSNLLLLVGRGGGEVTQPVDENSGGGGGGSALASDRKSYGSGDFSTSSTTFVVINSALDITLSTGARRCLVAWTLTVVPGTGQAQVDVEIDGSRAGGGYGLAHTGGNGINQNLSGSYLTDALSAGSHTFKLMVRVDGGGATFRANSSGSPAIFSVVELYT